MNITECYKTLQVPVGANEKDITASYKKLALKYHPDKNPGQEEWANDIMARVNHAYTEVMSYKFKEDITQPEKPKPRPKESPKNKQPKQKTEKKKESAKPSDNRQELIDSFFEIRENAKDFFYQYFQYNLNSFPSRDKHSHRSTYERIVLMMRKTFHSVEKLKKMTKDSELIEHFTVFNHVVFNFYKASECINILDSYNNQYEVEAFRYYRAGDEHLHQGQKEIFYNRHNRGTIKLEYAYTEIVRALKHFQNLLNTYPQSTWIVETQIKLEYAQSLQKYVELFFSDN